MKKYIFLSLLSLVILSSYAQTYIVQFSDGGNIWGYKNVNGSVAIEPQDEPGARFYDISPDGVYVKEVPKKNLWELYDMTHTKIEIPFEKIAVPMLVHPGSGYKNRGSRDGILVLTVKGDFAAIDVKGNIVHEPVYDKITAFDEGYASASRKDELFILDKSGNALAVNIPNIIKIEEFNQKRAIILDKAKLQGIIDEKGTVILAPTYLSIGDFHADRAYVKTSTGKVGFIDLQGNLVIDTIYERVHRFDEESGLAVAKTADESFYIDVNGKRYDFPNIPQVVNFSNGLARISVDDKTGFVNNKGEIVIPPSYTSTRSFHHGYCAAKEGDKWGLIDKNGNWVIPPEHVRVNDVIEVK